MVIGALVPDGGWVMEAVERGSEYRYTDLHKESGYFVSDGCLAGSIDPIDRHSQGTRL